MHIINQIALRRIKAMNKKFYVRKINIPLSCISILLSLAATILQHCIWMCDVMCVCVYAGGVRKGQNAISAAMYLPIRFSKQSDCHTILMHFHFLGHIYALKPDSKNEFVCEYVCVCLNVFMFRCFAMRAVITYGNLR